MKKREKNKKLFQFIEIAHQSKTESKETISRKKKMFPCAFNQYYIKI